MATSRATACASRELISRSRSSTSREHQAQTGLATASDVGWKSDQTATVLANSGAHQLTGASTWILAQPRVGSLVTIYAAETMSTANITIVSTSTAGQVAFNSAGGTQKLVLSPTSAGAGEGMSVTLLGEPATQWRIISAWPKLSADSTTNGVKVTT
jgi:hypothetical protein